MHYFKKIKTTLYVSSGNTPKRDLNIDYRIANVDYRNANVENRIVNDAFGTGKCLFVVKM